MSDTPWMSGYHVDVSVDLEDAENPVFARVYLEYKKAGEEFRVVLDQARGATVEEAMRRALKDIIGGFQALQQRLAAKPKKARATK